MKYKKCDNRPPVSSLGSLVDLGRTVALFIIISLWGFQTMKLSLYDGQLRYLCQEHL